MKEETEHDIMVLTAFLLQKTKSTNDNEALVKFKASISKFNFDRPVSDEEAIGSSFDLLSDLTKATAWKGDDKLIASLEASYRINLQVQELTGQETGSFITKLIDRFRRRRDR